MNLAELKTKYKIDRATHEPNPNCKFCKGTGERPNKIRPGQLTFCICLYVDHEMSDEAGTLLSQFATKQLNEMRKQK